MIIDFSRPEASLALCDASKGQIKRLSLGQQAFDDAQEAQLHKAAEDVPILLCEHSYGVNLLLKLVEKAAKALGPEWDIEIVESHHNQKLMPHLVQASA